MPASNGVLYAKKNGTWQPISTSGPVGPQGIPGPVGPMGPPGVNIVACAYDAWPPADPQPNTLYLRLAP